jgi:hypothetical protein
MFRDQQSTIDHLLTNDPAAISHTHSQTIRLSDHNLLSCRITVSSEALWKIDPKWQSDLLATNREYRALYSESLDSALETVQTEFNCICDSSIPARSRATNTNSLSRATNRSCLNAFLKKAVGHKKGLILSSFVQIKDFIDEFLTLYLILEVANWSHPLKMTLFIWERRATYGIAAIDIGTEKTAFKSN